MNTLDTFFDKKYAKYKNRLHHVYARLYRTQIYNEYLNYKKHKNFQINDGILKINTLLKKIQKYNKNDPKIIEELSRFTKKNQKRYIITLFLKVYNSWKFLKNHGFILSFLSKYIFNLSLIRIWKVKKKRYNNYIRTSFGSRKYTKRYFLTKGFPMKTLDDVRCWLFYFKKINKTNISLQFQKKQYLYHNNPNIDFYSSFFFKFNCLYLFVLKNLNNIYFQKKKLFYNFGINLDFFTISLENRTTTTNFLYFLQNLNKNKIKNFYIYFCLKGFFFNFFFSKIGIYLEKNNKNKFFTYLVNFFLINLNITKKTIFSIIDNFLFVYFNNYKTIQQNFLIYSFSGLYLKQSKILVNLDLSNFFLENLMLDTNKMYSYFKNVIS